MGAITSARRAPKSNDDEEKDHQPISPPGFLQKLVDVHPFRGSIQPNALTFENIMYNMTRPEARMLIGFDFENPSIIVPSD